MIAMWQGQWLAPIPYTASGQYVHVDSQDRTFLLQAQRQKPASLRDPFFLFCKNPKRQDGEACNRHEEVRQNPAESAGPYFLLELKRRSIISALSHFMQFDGFLPIFVSARQLQNSSGQGRQHVQLLGQQDMSGSRTARVFPQIF
jgi:hypothetical protein